MVIGKFETIIIFLLPRSMEESMQEKLTRQGSSVRPGLGAYGSPHMLNAFLGDTLGTKVKGPEFLQSRRRWGVGGGNQ